MSSIDELITRHCPNGVEFFSIGDVAKTVAGLSGKAKGDFTGGSARFVSYMNAFANLAVNQQALDFVAVRPGERQNRLLEGDVVITGSSESLDEVGMSSVVTSGPIEPLYLNSFCFALRLNDPERLLPDFSKYLFRSEALRKQIRATANGVTRINISKSRFLKVRIPVPPLEVQREIVRVLDQFTLLEAELEAELEARRRQYAFYRDSLLTSDNGVESYPLSELADFKYGFTASAAESGEYRFLRITDITPWGKLSPEGAKYVASTDAARGYLVGPGDLLMARTGATYGKTMLVGSGVPAVYASFLIRIRFKQPNVLPAYYWHFAQSNLYWSQANKMVSTGGQPQFNANVLKLVQVPVPPIDQQESIVRLLDRFDALVNDLSIGLPAELTARRKQYEYYRDRLLTFEEAVV